MKKFETSPSHPLWIGISQRLPSGWRVHDVLDMPQFGVIRVGAIHPGGTVDVPIAYSRLITSIDVDAAIVQEITECIERTEALHVAAR